MTDAQVQAGARSGETWEQARRRLEAANFACPLEADHIDVDPALIRKPTSHKDFSIAADTRRRFLPGIKNKNVYKYNPDYSGVAYSKTGFKLVL